MRIKRGVKLRGFSPQCSLAAAIVGSVYQDHGYELVITSASEGKHSRGSLHYSGNAFDCRTSSLDPLDIPKITREVKERLGTEFDALFEEKPPHIHVEYQPKDRG